jgi:hypothetical protein
MRAISVHRYRSIVEFTHLNFRTASEPQVVKCINAEPSSREKESTSRGRTLRIRFGDVLVHRREVQQGWGLQSALPQFDREAPGKCDIVSYR